MDEIELLKTMVSIYSPTKEEGRLADFLVQAMADNGFKSSLDEVGNVVGTVGEGSEDILLVGHMDTVPGEIPVKVENGVLYGRGSVDAKGSLAAMICAASNLAGLEDEKIVVIGVVDEEGDSLGTKNLLERYDPKCVIIGEPSGWDSVTIGYKGCLKFDYRLRGSNLHVGTPDFNPVESGVEFWRSLKEVCNPYSAESVFDSLTPKLVSFNTSNDGLRTQVDMQIDVRIPPATNVIEVKRSISGVTGNGEVKWVSEEKPVVSSKNSFLTRAFVSAIRGAGGNPSFKKKLGTSDMNILGNRWQAPVVAYGPGDSKLDHTPNECLPLDEYH
ncbi:MAG: [LysW]-lysine hydrolase, partial [Thermoplasmata archaeon]